MKNHAWILWLAPIGVWAVYMCWLTGFQSGYDAGHNDGWATARRAFMPQWRGEPDGEGHLQREVSLFRDTNAAELPQ